jgi:hypothetical protein
MKACATTVELKAAFKKFQKLPVWPMEAKQNRQQLLGNWLADRANELSLPALAAHGFVELQPEPK